jgi:tetratricopeptide (TPR) repeat protein
MHSSGQSRPPGGPESDAIKEPLEAIAHSTPAAIDLLGLLAHLAPEWIAAEAIARGTAAFPDRLAAAVRSEPGLDRLIEVLAENALVESGGGALRVSERIQEDVRAAMSESARKGWTRSAVRFVLAVFPVQSAYDAIVPACDRLMPHARAAVDHAEALQVAAEPAGALMNQAGLYLHACGALSEAEPCLRRAIAFGERAAQDESNVAVRWNNLGVVLQDLERLDEACACFERAIEIVREKSGATHEALAQPLRNLYTLQLAQQQWERARDTCTAAADVYAEHCDFDDPLVAECGNALGIVSSKLGEPEVAKKYFEKAILSASNAQRKSPALLATYHANFGRMLLELGEFDDALREFKEALDIDRELFQDNHVAVARDLANIGDVFHARQRYADAQAHYEEALHVSMQAAGEFSPDNLSILRRLERLFETTQNMRGLVKSLAKTLAIEEKRFGTGAPQLIAPLVRLGRALETREKAERAQACYERALELQRAIPQKSAENEAMIRHRLGRVLSVQGRFEEAIPQFERAARLHRKVHGEQHVNVARDAFHLGCALIEAGDDLRGAGHLSLAREIYEAQLGPLHRRTLEAQEKLDELHGG